MTTKIFTSFSISLLVLMLSGCVSAGDIGMGTVDDDADVRASVVEWARLAQNAHNIQPWRVVYDPERPNRFSVYVDQSRLLPETDPPARQITISIGTFLSVVDARAAQLGRTAQIDLLPNGEFDLETIGRDPVAVVTLVENDSATSSVSSAADPDAITRPTVKYHYQSADVPPTLRDKIESYSTDSIGIRVITDPDDVTWLNALSIEAFALEMATEATLMETYGVTRMTRRQRRVDPYGLAFTANFGPAMLRVVEVASAVFPQSPDAYGRTGTSIFTKAMDEISTYVLISTTDNTRRTQIETGYHLQALWMDLHKAGFVALPNSQALQEYAEMAPLYDTIHARYAPDGETIQMALAVAEPKSWRRRHSPRLPVDSIVE